MLYFKKCGDRSLPGSAPLVRSLARGTALASALTLGAAAGLTRGDPTPPPAPATRPDLILISLDTLRADRLNVYGYRDREVSPSIDALARDAIVFDQHTTTSPWTTPAHLSLLTSQHPTSHGVTQSFGELARQLAEERLVQRLPESRVTLAEALAAGGWATAAYTGGGTLDPTIGFDQGFTSYDLGMAKLSRSSIGRLDQWIAGNGARPFFLFLHTFEVHSPYLDRRYLAEVLPEDQVRELGRDFVRRAREHERGLVPGYGLRKILTRHGVFNREVCDALYMGGVRSADGWVGELVAGLKRRGLYDRSIIVLTSDHGEELGQRSPEQIYDGHGHTLYEELVRVPLIVKLPGQAHAGRRVTAVTSAVDVMPTLLDVLGVPLPEDAQGVSLRGLWEGTATPQPPRPAFAEALGEDVEKKAVRAGRYKYIVSVDAGTVARHGRAYLPAMPSARELYDLRADPGETMNLLAERRSSEAEAVAAGLDRLLRTHVGRVRGPAPSLATLAPRMAQQLAALGYLQ
jgi:arylsulfatase A-like enzyme